MILIQQQERVLLWKRLMVIISSNGLCFFHLIDESQQWICLYQLGNTCTFLLTLMVITLLGWLEEILISQRSHP